MQDQIQDKELDCKDCGSSFVFTSGEQAFYEERGFNPPKRCQNCRNKKKDRYNNRDRKDQ